jgi:type II secretory pathway pseudopilin PulG
MLVSVTLVDTLENGAEPNPVARRLVVAVVAVVVVALAIGTLYRSAERRHERAAFDRLLSLAADAQASVQQAQSHATDVARYVDPFVNSPTTPRGVRQAFDVAVSTTARQGQTDIDAQRQRIAADTTARSGRLRTAKNAMLAYLSSWSAFYAKAAGAGQSPSPDALSAQQRAARTALVNAAPDDERAVKAAAVLGASTDTQGS